MVDIIFYGYDMAPNPQKLLQFLSLFKIPYHYVEIPVTLPRPDLDAIGITYRRTPLLSIDSDMYVDTSLIITKLCDMAAHSDCGVDAHNHVEFFHLGEQIFKCATALIPETHPLLQDEDFVKDRSALHGRSFDAKSMAQVRPMVLNTMLSYLSLIQRNFLSDKRFIMGGSTPTTADLYLYWAVNWGLRYHDGTRPEISESTHPVIFGWLDHVESFLDGRDCGTKMSFSDAKEILVRPPKHEYAKFVHHDPQNALGLVPGRAVSVTPDDSGKSHPQKGTLISFNADQICLRNSENLVMHFPNLGYSVKAA